MRISPKVHSAGFTLMETMIVVSILIIVAGIWMWSDPMAMYKKARDSTRKNDLNKLARIMEDYYNDYQRYPPGSQNGGPISGIQWGQPFEPYADKLPSDPLSPHFDYTYVTDPNSQNFYALFAKLENNSDNDIKDSGCERGCGPDQKYNYVIHSTNVMMIAGNPTVPGSIGAGPGGGGGGGGGGNPTSTPAGGPSPTPFGWVPPTPEPPVPGGCQYMQCGPCSPCGNNITVSQGWRCEYDGTNWLRVKDVTCP